MIAGEVEFQDVTGTVLIPLYGVLATHEKKSVEFGEDGTPLDNTWVFRRSITSARSSDVEDLPLRSVALFQGQRYIVEDMDFKTATVVISAVRRERKN